MKNTYSWEQRKLGDTVQITMGQSPDGSTYSDVPSDYILVQDNADLHNGWVFPRVWTSQMTKKADVGDLIMSVRAPAGAMGKTAYNAVIGRGVAAIKGNEFIYQLLVKMNSNGYWKALSCGSTFESLNSDSIKNADVLIPEVAEQEKIGEYFANLDHIITLHQRKYDSLVNVKKAMFEKMFPKNGETVPEIRFKGFTDTWEQREFDDFFEYIPHNSLSRDNLNYDEGEVKNIHYGDVLIKFGEVLNPTIEKIPFVNKDIKFDDKSCFLQDGDIVIADAAEDLTVGKCTEISNGCNQKLVAGLHTIPCRPKNKIEEGFLGFYLNSKAYHNQLLPLIQGTKVSSISKSSLKETWVTFPFSSNEQKKIGSFFLTLNNLITLHQRRLEKLKNIKKSCLEKMFV